MKCQWLCVSLLTVCGSIVEAQQQQYGDPLQDLLISPEVLIHHHTEIGLPAPQVERIRVLLEKMQPDMHALQQQSHLASCTTQPKQCPSPAPCCIQNLLYCQLFTC